MSRLWSAVVEGLRRVASLSDRPGPIGSHVPDAPVPQDGGVFENDFEYRRPGLAHDQALTFLRSLNGTRRLTDRNGRLLAVFVAEFMGPGYWDGETPTDLALALRLADGTLPDAERAAALVRRPRVGFHTRQGTHNLAHALLNWSGVQAAYHTLTHFGYRDPTLHERIGTPGVDHFLTLMADPFPPEGWRGAFDPSWRTHAAIDLANGLFASNDFSVLPILADLLEEAGCDDVAILAHCRGPDTHVRGCWVVDLVLGKA
jgi:hypothetical protein